jgi:uncharacterized protein YbjT (DUF2867 family)/uncharacterized protein YndB with AHSA1/START domain
MIALTGASGYVGGRLLPRLEARGLGVRCLARHAARLRSRAGPGTEVVEADVLDRASLDRALAGVECAYYLVHSMGAAQGFEDLDRQGARNFGEAAARAGVRRIVYLGGLGEDSAELSAHLRSRHEVGDVLRACGVPVVELRASIVIGSGSLSFEMIRALVERLPVMVTPRWVRVEAQPVAIDDLLAYLERAASVDLPGGAIVEIGGADRVSYGDLMREYARQRGLRRWMIPVPFLTPRLSSLWLGLVTPLYARVGRKLIESIESPTVVRDPGPARAFGVESRGVAAAIAAALRSEDREFAETRWSDALSSSGASSSRYGGMRVQGRLVDSRSVRVDATPARAFVPIRRIGGAAGWYAFDGLWRLRGALDLLAGGVGLRRGRRDPDDVREGDVIDWWRVQAVEPGRRLLLVAGMKLPGRAWLEFEVTPEAGGGSRIRQTATFDPRGLLGILYWYGIWPLHALVFRGMLSAIARRVRP